MDRPVETALPALAPSRPQKPWLALPSTQRILLKQLKLVGIPQQVGGDDLMGWGAHGHGVALGHPCQAHISRPKCGSGQHRPWSVRGLHQRGEGKKHGFGSRQIWFPVPVFPLIHCVFWGKSLPFSKSLFLPVKGE